MLTKLNRLWVVEESFDPTFFCDAVFNNGPPTLPGWEMVLHDVALFGLVQNAKKNAHQLISRKRKKIMSAIALTYLDSVQSLLYRCMSAAVVIKGAISPLRTNRSKRSPGCFNYLLMSSYYAK